MSNHDEWLRRHLTMQTLYDDDEEFTHDQVDRMLEALKGSGLLYSENGEVNPSARALAVLALRAAREIFAEIDGIA